MDTLMNATAANLRLEDAIKDGKFSLDFVKNLVSQIDFHTKQDSMVSLFWSGKLETSSGVIDSSKIASKIGQSDEFYDAKGSMIGDSEIGKFVLVTPKAVKML